MGGETEKQVSGWTVDTVKESIFRELEALKNDIDRRFAAQDKGVETAFNAAKEAVIKSEIGVEKRSDAVYVTLSKLSDALAGQMPRAEAEQRFAALSEKIDALKTSRDTNQGKETQKDLSIVKIGIIVGAVVGVAGVLITIVVLAFNN